MSAKFLLNFILLATAVMASQQLSMKVSGPSRADSISDLWFTTTITNDGDETLRILEDPNSAMDNFEAEKFTFSGPSGIQPSFVGARVKYVPAVAAKNYGYITLEPNRTVTVEHDLSKSYVFNHQKDVAYTVHAEPTFTLVNPDFSLDTLTASVTPHIAIISSGLVRPISRRLSRRAKFIGCSDEQQGIINTAIVAAIAYVTDGEQYATDPPSESTGERYATWFGMENPQRHETVNSILNSIKGNDFTEFTYDCTTCAKPNSYAYVYRNTFGTIYLCPRFWTAQTRGTDSQGGTIVHEASHFVTNGGTRDYAYGQNKCMQLARANPGSAINNADSYEYFVENSPFLN